MAVLSTGGDKFDAALERVAKRLERGGSVRVGFFADAKYPDGTPVAMVAAIQNAGAPSRGIPPRPFFSRMIRKESPQWGERFVAALKANDYDLELTLDKFGQGVASQLHGAITEFEGVPLSEVTVMLRKMKREDPDLAARGVTFADVLTARSRVAAGESTAGTSRALLKDTARMLVSVGYEVNEDGPTYPFAGEAGA